MEPPPGRPGEPAAARRGGVVNLADINRMQSSMPAVHVVVRDLETPTSTRPLVFKSPRSLAAMSAGRWSADDEQAPMVMMSGKTTSREEHSFRDNLEFMRTDQYGSRAVGGQKPQNEKVYWAVEAVDYLVPDTKQEEENERAYTPKKRNRRRLFLWVLYALLGVAVSVVIYSVLGICDFITAERVAVGETVILLHPRLPLSGVSTRMERERAAK